MKASGPPTSERVPSRSPALCALPGPRRARRCFGTGGALVPTRHLRPGSYGCPGGVRRPLPAALLRLPCGTGRAGPASRCRLSRERVPTRLCHRGSVFREVPRTGWPAGTRAAIAASFPPKSRRRSQRGEGERGLSCPWKTTFLPSAAQPSPGSAGAPACAPAQGHAATSPCGDFFPGKPAPYTA